MPTRRDALVTIAAGVIAPTVLGAQNALQAGDSKLIAKLADLIIPRTDTPGASDAGVPIYIDRVARNNPPLATKLREGLEAFRSVGFLELSEADQTKLLLGSPIFPILKGLTIDGYYTSKEGLVTELGWHGNTYVHEFTGCTHPEHQTAEHEKDSHAD
jgi:gluconate 2-dehydrogenase gamma chain